MRKTQQRKALYTAISLLVCLMILTGITSACTGITLKSGNGDILVGRTMEWGAFDLHSRVSIIPRGYKFTGSTPVGKNGITWTAKYAAFGMDALGRTDLLDGMNEKGLTCQVFYHPGFAVYPKYDPSKSSKSLGPMDITQYILTNFSTVEEVKKGITKVDVVPVVEPAISMAPPIHLLVTDPEGNSIVIEYLKEKTVVYDNPLGVITNAPEFDWHITNLRNYVNLSPVALPSKNIDDMDFSPLGAGSGLIGLPGDFTPPSRFIRAVAFTATARKTDTGEETMYEMFRILDNFNLPLGAAEGSDIEGHKKSDMRSSTIWTDVWDTKNLVLYYHTQHNRRVRKIDFKKIDFNKLKGKIISIPLDKVKKQDMEEIEVKN